MVFSSMQPKKIYWIGSTIFWQPFYLLLMAWSLMIRDFKMRNANGPRVIRKTLGCPIHWMTFGKRRSWRASCSIIRHWTQGIHNVILKYFSRTLVPFFQTITHINVHHISSVYACLPEYHPLLVLIWKATGMCFE